MKMENGGWLPAPTHGMCESLLPMFRGRGLRRRFWLVRGARPGKPGRQTAAASRRTPQGAGDQAKSNGAVSPGNITRRSDATPLRLAIFRSRGFDFEDAVYLVPGAASMRRRDRTHARRRMEGVIPRASVLPYRQRRARRIRSLRLLAES